MTVALMIGGDGARWLISRVSKSLGRKVMGSNPTGAVSDIGQVRYPTLLKVVVAYWKVKTPCHANGECIN